MTTPRIRKTVAVPEASTFQIHLVNPAYPPEMKAARLDALLRQYRNMTPEQQANVREELAELGAAIEPEGSDTGTETNLRDAGYGSQGIV
jgi:hypothetical protein